MDTTEQGTEQGTGVTTPSSEERLRDGFRGELVGPTDPAYDDARKLYNAMIDKRPRQIARCRDAADVIAAVSYAREADMLVAIRGGGHSGPGLGSCDGGMVVDLGAMRSVRVDPAARRARIDGGCRWGDVDHATGAFGLATPSGIISTTGVGGLTLGGGHGYLTRKYGLSIDNLVSADVVLADGRLVQASADHEPDLFWALRGGGGNFGVVTSFEFELHPVSTVYAGVSLWSLEDGDEVMHWYRDFLPAAPEELYGFFTFMVVPPVAPFPTELHYRKVCGVVWCSTAPADEAADLLAPLASTPDRLFEHLGEMPYRVVQSQFDGLYPPGLQWYWRGDFVSELSSEAIALHVENANLIPTMYSTMHLYPVDGAVHRVGESDTAFSYRDCLWSQVIVGVDPDPAGVQAITQWTREYSDALHPYSAGGAYVNFMMNEGIERIRATYRGNYDRLVEVKESYDPDNVFCVNQNIVPTH